MCRLHTVIPTIKWSATETFQWSPKTEITAIKLWCYDFPLPRCSPEGNMRDPRTVALRCKQPSLNGERNGKWNAQHHRSQRRTREADYVPWTNPTVDDGRSKGKRR